MSIQELKRSAVDMPRDMVFLNPANEGTLGSLAEVGAPSGIPSYSSWALTTVEGVAVVLSSILSGVAYDLFEYGRTGSVLQFVGTGVIVALLYCASMRAVVESSYGRLGVARQAVAVWTFAFLILSFFLFALKAGSNISRGAVLTFYVVGLGNIVAVRYWGPAVLTRVLGNFSLTDAIIVGMSGCPQIAEVAETLRAAGRATSAIFTIEDCPGEMEWYERLAQLTSRITAQALIAGHGEIYVLAAGFPSERVASLTAALQFLPRAVRLVPEPDVEQMFHFPVRRVGHTFMVELQRAPLNFAQRVIKRGVDFSVALLALVFIMPLLAMIAIAIKLDSPGPVFFRQTRLGRGGTPFRIFKFRSMVVLEDGGEIVQTRKGDARVTRVGRVLRRTSLDELPQLFNVLKGEMSLIGPRPHAVAHDKLYGRLIENYEVRQHVKPGITGWAQVHGYRGETPTTDLMRKRVEFDLWYAKNASIRLDLTILIKTLLVVLGQSKAY